MKPTLYSVRSYDTSDSREFVTPDMAHYTAREVSRKRAGAPGVAVIANGLTLGWYVDGMRVDDIREGVERVPSETKPEPFF